MMADNDMRDNDVMPGKGLDEDNTALDLDGARAALIAALDGAAPHRSDAGADGSLVKPGEQGYSVELRLNGETITLDGKDVNALAIDDFTAFLDRQRQAVDAGALDDQITRALATPGPGKALIRVRAIDGDAA